VEIRSQQFGNEINIFKRRDKHIGQSDDVLVLDVLEELQFSISALGQDRSREGLHDLLDGDGRSHELIFCRAVNCIVNFNVNCATVTAVDIGIGERSAKKVRLAGWCGMTSIRCWCNFLPQEPTASCGPGSRVATRSTYGEELPSERWPRGLRIE